MKPASPSPDKRTPLGLTTHISVSVSIFARCHEKADDLLRQTGGYPGTRESIKGGTRVLKSWTPSSSIKKESLCRVMQGQEWLYLAGTIIRRQLIVVNCYPVPNTYWKVNLSVLLSRFQSTSIVF